MTETVAHRRGGQRFLVVLLFLVLLMVGTWLVRTWQVAYVRATVAERQARAVAEAVGFIEAAFQAEQQDLLAQARVLAEAGVVRQALRARRRGTTEGLEALVTYFAGLGLPPQTAVEVYDPVPLLVAWHGFSMPLDEAPNMTRFLETYQTAVVRDGALRWALVAWWPVREGRQVLGAVRVMRLVEVVYPVQNQYVRDYSLARIWQRRAQLPVRVQWGDVEAVGAPRQGDGRLLQGADGTVLGQVLVQPPSVDELVQARKARSDDVLAFWQTLILFWLVAGAWRWYRAAEAQPATADVHTQLRSIGGRFALVTLVWWGVRYLLLRLEVPARWQTGRAPLSPLFDPMHLASPLGEGLMRSSGDLLLTALFALLFSIAFIDLATHFRERQLDLYRLRSRLAGRPPERPSAVRFMGVVLVLTGTITALIWGLSLATQHAILDSTLDYFSRSGLLPGQPERMVVVVFGSLLLLTVAVLLVAVGLTWISLWLLLRYRPPRWSLAMLAAVVLGTVVLVPVLLYRLPGFGEAVPWESMAAFLTTGLCIAAFGLVMRGNGLELLTLRSVLLAVFMITVLLYPLFYNGLDRKQRMQMEDAVETFDRGRDPRITASIRQILEEVRDDDEVHRILTDSVITDAERLQLDSLAVERVRGLLFSSLGPYDVRLTFFDAEGQPLGRYYEAEQTLERHALDAVDQAEFEIQRRMYEESGARGLMVETMTSGVERDRFDYVGTAPIQAAGQAAPVGWVTARVEPRAPFQHYETPFPRVLLPAGYFGNLQANLSIAVFQDGLLVRVLRRDFGRYRLSEDVQQQLVSQAQVWSKERVKERWYLTYYQRQQPMLLPTGAPPPTGTTVIAVRAPALGTFDHLYYLLRLTVAGLFLGLPLYLVGLSLRHGAGLLPAERVRFRDKVLNAFLGVGLVAVATVGFIGRAVVLEEAEDAILNQLREHLERVEQTLMREARAGELPYRVLSRMRVDSLSALVGLDLNVYQNAELRASSRPQLLRDRLIDERLPVEAYKALYFDGFRFTHTDERIGSFTYKAGFRALMDEQGRPHYIVSVPIPPEQERIEEERARTIAYLFGSLLLILLVVMLTASLLANAIARPIGRLRAGLEAVAKGQYERTIPVTTRDEIGELVQTFNGMQQQLAESRRKVAQQERQLAWREMARQVAHEIKNPLTPMKLSVQHLRRAYDGLGRNGERDVQQGKFNNLFERITGTLIEQIDTLARIANEFHSFARMPTRILERLDLNAVVEEAVALMQEESGAEIEVQLHPEPLIVEADHEELRRIYINLIKNAIQAIPDGAEGRVEVTTQHRADAEAFAYSTVTDNGTGVPAALRDKIFEPNFSTKTSGTGLGLAITKKSIEELRGVVGFETEEGVGTTFWIQLPLAEEQD